MKAERLLVLLSVAAALAYPMVWDAWLPASAEIALKGAGVALLALAAAVRARERDGWLLAAVMALGAAGDVLLELMFMAGVAAFATGHAVAIFLHLSNRRSRLGASDLVVPALLLAFGTAMPAVLLGGTADFLPFLVYSLLLSAMAAAAWTSRFPRPLTGLGALLFVTSDALIALRMSQPQLQLGAAIWLLYYAGQLLIFTGVRLSSPRPR